ncbi:MAG: hypothetical protein OXH57_07995 [Ekhidna sp.]|nr:hypothetical protein [Ekhidna sp.]
MCSCKNDKTLCRASPLRKEDIFKFSIANKDGDDLLNPSISNSHNNNSIRVYQKVDAQYELVSNPRGDFPDGYIITEYESTYRIIPLFEGTSGLIVWNTAEQDTINLECSFDGRVEFLSKIYYNTELVLMMNSEKVKDFFSYQVNRNLK